MPGRCITDHQLLTHRRWQGCQDSNPDRTVLRRPAGCRFPFARSWLVRYTANPACLCRSRIFLLVLTRQQPESMNSSAAAILCDPRPSDHIVYSYADDNDLADAVTLFASAGLAKKEAVILVVTPNHSDVIWRRLEHEGFNMPELQESGQFLFADAADVLATFLLDGVIDEHRFKTGIGSMIDTARDHRGRARPVRLFGEMVDLIWISNPDATLRLEQLGNEVIESHSVTVLCAYALGGDRPTSLPAPLLACHSRALSMVRWEAEHRCETCDSTDLVIVNTKAIADELVECRGCMRLYRIEYQSDGTTRLVAV
jgi:hypothetical protein